MVNFRIPEICSVRFNAAFHKYTHVSFSLAAQLCRGHSRLCNSTFQVVPVVARGDCRLPEQLFSMAGVCSNCFMWLGWFCTAVGTREGH